MWQVLFQVVEVLNLSSLGERILADLMESWWIILLSLLMATLISFLWIYLMKYMSWWL